MDDADVRPLLRAIEYVVQEGRRHAAAGHDDHFVAVARAASAALLWRRYDRLGNYDEAARYLNMIPQPEGA